MRPQKAVVRVGGNVSTPSIGASQARLPAVPTNIDDRRMTSVCTARFTCGRIPWSRVITFGIPPKMIVLVLVEPDACAERHDRLAAGQTLHD